MAAEGICNPGQVCPGIGIGGRIAVGIGTAFDPSLVVVLVAGLQVSVYGDGFQVSVSVVGYYQSLYNKLIFHFSIKIKEVSV